MRTDRRGVACLRMILWRRLRDADIAGLPQGWAAALWAPVACFLALTVATGANLLLWVLMGQSEDVCAVLAQIPPSELVISQIASAIYLAVEAGVIALLWGLVIRPHRVVWGILAQTPIVAAARILLPLSIYRVVVPLVGMIGNHTYIMPDVADTIVTQGIIVIAAALSVSELTANRLRRARTTAEK